MTEQPPDHWKIVGPAGVLTRRYATRQDAEELRCLLSNPGAYHLCAYNHYGKVVWDEIEDPPSRG